MGEGIVHFRIFCSLSGVAAYDERCLCFMVSRDVILTLLTNF